LKTSGKEVKSMFSSRLLHISPGALAWLLAVSAGEAEAATSSLIELESYLRVFWGLGIVMAIILILYALLRKRFSLFAGHPQKHITIVEIKPLSGRKSLCLVRVKDQEFLIGLSGDRISHLATLSGPSSPSFAATLASAGKELQP
jgi:flagellar protein FliO/FliZ